jgi:hypothetical protein
MLGSNQVYDFGDNVLVVLDTATGADVCPIMHERFQDVKLDVGGGKSFLRSQPDTCVAKLACGHTFSLLGIMYQFVLVDMRCPLCRQGPCKRTKISQIPHGWRQCMGVKLRSMQAEEKDELEVRTLLLLKHPTVILYYTYSRTNITCVLVLKQAADAEVARSLQLEEDSPLSMLTEDSIVNMTVYMFDRARTIHFQSYELSRIHGGMQFCLLERETSNIIEVLQSTRSDSLRITVHSRTPGGIPVELANSPVIPSSVLSSSTVDLVFETPRTSMVIRRSSTGISFYLDAIQSDEV